MTSQVKHNFVRQQGFEGVPSGSCDARFKALNFQPKVVGLLVLAAVLLQSAPLFLALSLVLWWSALMPRWSPFDALHNALFARSGRMMELTPAPAPRRFSMGMAGTFVLGAGASIVAGMGTAAVVFQGFVAVALTALIFCKFCLGSYIYHLLRGNYILANSTLPWAKG